jgi:prephenate dehydratase
MDKALKIFKNIIKMNSKNNTRFLYVNNKINDRVDQRNYSFNAKWYSDNGELQKYYRYYFFE